MNVKIRNNCFRRNYNNFGLYSERAKWRLVHEPETREFFWRTAQQQEVDLVEESASGVKAFEFKWNPRKAGVLPPKTFRTAYPDADCRTITPETVFEFLSNG